MEKMVARPTITQKDRDKFVTRYQVQSNGCWLWTDRRGDLLPDHKYGKMRLEEGSAPTAHRLSYWLWLDDIPVNHNVTQRCGHKACVNPDHLEVRPSNTQKGSKWRLRWPRTVSNKLAWEIWDQHHGIRADAACIPVPILADAYSLPEELVEEICTERTHQYLKANT